MLLILFHTGFREFRVLGSQHCAGSAGLNLNTSLRNLDSSGYLLLADTKAANKQYANRKLGKKRYIVTLNSSSSPCNDHYRSTDLKP